MSRSCHSATFSSAAWALPRSTRASPEICSLLIGLRLCGIDEEPFWPGPERLLRLAHLGALQVADLGREALEAGAGERDRAQQLGVAVARDDLRRDVLAREAEAREHARLELGAGRGVRADRARDRADRRPASKRALAGARALRCASKAKPASLTPKVVGSACTPWVRPTHSVSTCSRARAASAATSSRAPATRTSPTARSCSASAVSSTSEEVSPKWIQRPASPAEAASTSTNAATSWSVTRSRSSTASTVNVAARIASSSASVGPPSRQAG